MWKSKQIWKVWGIESMIFVELSIWTSDGFIDFVSYFIQSNTPFFLLLIIKFKNIFNIFRTIWYISVHFGTIKFVPPPRRWYRLFWNRIPWISIRLFDLLPWNFRKFYLKFATKMSLYWTIEPSKYNWALVIE